MAQTKPKAGQFYGVSNNGTDGQFLKTDGAGGMSWAAPIQDPTITSIDYPGTATAADPAGGESVIINGTLFASGITCTVGGTSAVTAFNSTNQITITTPAKAAGQYAVAVTNPDGGTVSQANFIQYSGVPVWSTASGSLGSVQEGDSASFQVTATEGSDTIEYAVTTGSLPTGLSLNTNTGAITGTAPSVSADTTTTFSITATDDENQTSSERSFSITVTNDGPSNHFTPILYTGNGYPNTGVSQTITTNFQPDFVITKGRNYTDYWGFQDSVRGAGYSILTGYSAGQQSSQNLTTISAFNSNGYSLGEDTSAIYNKNNEEYVSYAFKAGGAAVSNTDGSITSSVSVNNTLGFSIVKYDGAGLSGSASTVGHGLDAAPQLMIIKCYEQGKTNSAIFVYAEGAGNTKEGYFYSDSAFTDDTGRWNSTSPTSTVFTLGSSWSSYPAYYAGDTIAYCFTSKTGFSKVGSYTGNGGTQTINTGFEPAFIMYKAIDSASKYWTIRDNKRGSEKVFYPNSPNAEQTKSPNNLLFLTNGFQMQDGDSYMNGPGVNYMYLAIAADPSTTTPSLANSFNTTLYNGSYSTPLNVNGIGFKADFSWLKVRNNTWSHGLFSSLMPYGVNGGVKNVYSNNQDAATDLWGTLTWNNNGWTLNGGSYNGSSAHDFGMSGYNFVSWNWKAGGGLASINTTGTRNSVVSANAAAGFSIVTWTGDNNTATIGHGLNAAPELIIVKKTSAGSDWPVYSSGLTSAAYRLVLNSTDSQSTTNDEWNSTAPTSTVFSVGNGGNVSDNGQSFIGYCFTSIAGYSKVGSYTGSNASGKVVTTGFQPSYVLFKSMTHAGSWAILDDKRTTGTNGKNRLYAQGSFAEDSAIDVEFTATGFTLLTNNSDVNGNYDYIYLAIKEN